jgi:outer membrane protein TolC
VLAKARVALLELRVQAASRALDSADQELRLGRIVETERAARLLELRNRELELNRLKIELASLLAQLRSLSGAETLGVNDLPDDLPDLEWDDSALAERLDEFRWLGLDTPRNTVAPATPATCTRTSASWPNRASCPPST